ncbi:low molecular weight protein-tyrosine-phosphatase [Gloeobacter morelensis]|uniref:Low molecular weight phosphotyrosine protein phosphatase n=1 Tax=Gloeobacter morelensis MG652769 TaxID=2781736 RepID=A0ABY3PR26_9CYAN|nr:low molecular weight protein-tyrosine-phosphatase [Gloeobacter morelensis]UFP96136.1 low molecular weight phosphotyrosine protein phosphatase [Gloeobacter morelensis MG652769]
MDEKLLFICMGNICRSPAAEGIMVHLLEKAGLGGRVVCDSAGTIAYHVGEPPDRRMRAAATRRGIALRGTARKFSPADFDHFDRILVMDRANYEDILDLDPSGRYRHKVKLVCEYCRLYPDREVPDPYYGGDAGFEHVLDLLLDACSGLLDAMRSGHVDRNR